MAEPLNLGQKILNQRLLAAHCLSEKEMREIFDEIADHHEMEDFQSSLASCNSQLQYIGLEIVAISKRGEDGPERHYAMVNSYPDEMSKKAFQPAIFQPPTQQAFVRAVYEKLVEEGLTVQRSVLLNLRNTLEDSISLQVAEDSVERLIEEKWLLESSKRNNAAISIAPRSFCELSYLLTEEFGMDKDALPQQVYHRM